MNINQKIDTIQNQKEQAQVLDKQEQDVSEYNLNQFLNVVWYNVQNLDAYKLFLIILFLIAVCFFFVLKKFGMKLN